MHTFRLVSILAAGFVALAAGTAAAQQAPTGKFGIVDTERILRDSKLSQQTQKSLEAEIQKREKEIAAGPKDQVARRRAALAEDINARREQELKKIIEKANGAIRRVAEAEKLDIVFQGAAYASKSIDITDKVIKEVDSGR